MSARGVAVCEADALAHEAMAPGTPVYKALICRFGNGVVAPSGEIDRAALAAHVFASEAERLALNAVVHPAVEAAWTAWLARQRGPAVVVVPLLFEAGYARGWDAVICVCAPRTARLARLRARGLTEEQAAARLRAQWPDPRKAASSDFVLWNGGEAGCLERQVERVLESMGRQG